MHAPRAFVVWTRNAAQGREFNARPLLPASYRGRTETDAFGSTSLADLDLDFEAALRPALAFRVLGARDLG